LTREAKAQTSKGKAKAGILCPHAKARLRPNIAANFVGLYIAIRGAVASGVTAIPGAPAPRRAPACWGAPPGARKKNFVYFSFSYQKDKNI